MDLLDRAREFARSAHAGIGHVRKYTGEPYIVHPAEVVSILEGVPHTDAMLAAAWLHDVVEDTPTSLEEVERAFGSEVAALVSDLTDVSRPEQGNRSVRKEIDRQHSARASPDAKTVKLADLIANVPDIVEHAPGFARTYLREAAALLEVLREGDPVLWQRARELVEAGRRQLRMR